MSDTTEADEPESVELLVRRINEAWVKGRFDELEDRFDEDMVIVPPGFQGRARGRLASIQSYREFGTAAAVREYAESDFVVDVWGRTAVATYRFEIAYTLNGRDYRDSGWDILVFAKESGTWKAVWRTLVPSPGENQAASP